MSLLRKDFTAFRALLLAGVAAAALSACATNRTTVSAPDFTGQGRVERQTTLDGLATRYRKDPKDKTAIIYYAAALRAAGQAEQAVAVLQAGVTANRDDLDIKVSYAKALSTAGRFDQALLIIDDAINPASPDWNALSVKGALLDQSGRNEEARLLYQQALTIAPTEASLYANLGLSYAMTNDLVQAETMLQRAVRMPRATSQIRQNLALVVGLQGRFEEAHAMYGQELPPDEVESNMAYIRALLTQQNRWDRIKGE